MVSPTIQPQKSQAMGDANPYSVKEEPSPDKKRQCSQKTKTILLIVLLLVLILQCCLFLGVMLTASQTCVDDMRNTVRKMECYFEGCNVTSDKTNGSQGMRIEVVEETVVMAVHPPSTTTPPTAIATTSSKPHNLGVGGRGTRKQVSIDRTRDFRMVKHAVPIHYSVHLNNHILEGRFEGKVNILLKVIEKKDFILLHIGPQLTVSNLTVRKESDVNTVKVVWSTRNSNEFLYIEPESPLEADSRYSVEVEYVGEYSDNLKGVYRSFYFVNEKPSFVVSTHFEPTYARMLFPCFDEPMYKATFDFSIEEDNAYKVLFNTPTQMTQAVSKTRTKHVFQTTPRMSPYLLAFVVCQYKSLSMKTRRGVPVNVHAPEHLLSQTRQALMYAVKSIDFLEQYLNSTYNLPKLDLVYIPDFGVSGMENWGLIFLNGVTMFNSRSSPTVQKVSVASTVIHEVAHQWFGNLVTAEWWSDLWLQEGFSTFFSFLVAQNVETGWSSFEYFPFTVQRAMRHEDRNRSRGLSSDITTKTQVRKAFNHVAYSKGAAVLRMFHDALGAEDMQTSISSYVNSYSGQSVKTNHFTDSIRAALQKKNKHELLNEWTTTNSYPIIHVTLKKGETVEFRQEKYISRHENKLWFIPVECITSHGDYVAFDLKEKQKSIKLKKFADWIKCNKDHKGYYRVNYDEDTWYKLAAIEFPNPFISNSDISNLIDDSYTLAFNLEISIDIPLEMMTSIRSVKSLVVWRTAILNYRRLWYHFEFKEPTYEHLRLFGKYFVFYMYRDLRSLNKNTDQRMLRRYLFDFAAELEFYSAVGQSSHMFDHWLDGERVHPDFRPTAISQGIKWGSRAVFFEAFSKYIDTKDDVEQRDILYGLAASRDENLLYLLLQYTEKPGVIKKQNARCVFKSVARSFVGRKVLWKYIIDLIIKRLGRSDSGDLISNDIINSELFDALLEHATNELELNEMRNSLQSSSLGSTEEGSLLMEYMESMSSMMQLGEMAQEQISKLVSQQSLEEIMESDKLVKLQLGVNQKLSSRLGL